MGRRCLCVRRGAGGKLKLLVQQRAPRGAELSLQGDRFGSPGRVVRRRGTFWGQAEDISSLERNPCAIPVCTHVTVTGWCGGVPAQHVLPHHAFPLGEPGCMGMARIPPSCALLSISPCWGLGRGVTLSSGDAFCISACGWHRAIWHSRTKALPYVAHLQVEADVEEEFFPFPATSQFGCYFQACSKS